MRWTRGVLGLYSCMEMLGHNDLITVGNSPTLCGNGEITWFIWLRVQPPNRLAFWGSVGPRDLKPAAIRVGACVAAR
jgi:hypothetical protein